VAGGAELDRLAIVRECYRAYETGERDLIEWHLSEQFEFFSPPDPGIDNTEIFTFDGDGIRRVEVYFGWDLE
jgi:hypothetical protein